MRAAVNGAQYTIDMARIRVKVVPKARESRLLFEDGQLKALLTSPPEKGKANQELLKLLKKVFGWNARIVSGMSSRNKIVEVDADEKEAMEALERFGESG